jgi:selenocysteine lyase/cysteine desulfurase
MHRLEDYFAQFRKNIIGIDFHYQTPYGNQKIIYNDWLASGRLYAPIEKILTERFGPYMANTHTETNVTGTVMTYAYYHARQIIKQHVNANHNDVLLFSDYGMTGAVNKLQRILGIKYSQNRPQSPNKNDRPVVFVTHMEHHSNHISWYETVADVVILPPDDHLMVSCDALENELVKYADRKLKIGAFTACSNVTGIITPYHQLAEIMHQHNGYCFVDFAASAPYVELNMHPDNPAQQLDAIYFSPHKFLGGPGGSGVVIFDSKLYNNPIPDQPGGGTVEWTNPWGEYQFIDDIETREDGGTPGILQAIKIALAIKLKEQMGVDKISQRDHELLDLALSNLKKIPGINIFASDVPNRIGVISFFHDTIHYNLIVKLLSDRFGIQIRGGCICAGTYGHYLLHISKNKSNDFVNRINQNDRSVKPGWLRFSLHPVTKDAEVLYFCSALQKIIDNIEQWQQDYHYDKRKNEFFHHNDNKTNIAVIKTFFELDL